MDVLFFTSPIGLGHATRDYAVAARLGGISARFVTGSAAARLLGRYGLDVIDAYSPPGFDVRDGAMGGHLRWLWSYYRYYRECKRVAGRMLAGERPRLVVSDEDFASLAVAQAAGIPTILITDILETRFTRGPLSAVERRMNRSMRDIASRCSAVILPEDGGREGNIRRVGPIVRETGRSRESLREDFGFAGKTILISAGGTDAGRFLIRRAADAASGLGDVVVVSGPSMEMDDVKARHMGFVTDMHELVYAADLVISLAGRSTIDEAAAYGTPGIFIPIAGHFEQEDNARRAGFSFDDVHRLGPLIRQKLSGRGDRAAPGGAAAAAGIIADALRQN